MLRNGGMELGKAMLSQTCAWPQPTHYAHWMLGKKIYLCLLVARSQVWMVPRAVTCHCEGSPRWPMASSGTPGWCRGVVPWIRLSIRRGGVGSSS